MKTVTDRELRPGGNDIERDAATVLGFMLFEYSRLDMELGLFLVWAGHGQELDEVTKKLNEANFSKRLDLLGKLADSKYSDTPAADEYANWLRDAHAVRVLRNQLFHGRWGFIPQKGLVANVVGLPTSPEQAEIRYSIAQLEESLQSMRDLRERLSELRRAWPV